MILVTGGAYQGKREFIKSRWSILDCEIIDLEGLRNPFSQVICYSQAEPGDNPDKAIDKATGESSEIPSGGEENSADFFTRLYGIICKKRAAVNYQEMIRLQIRNSLDPEEELHRLVDNNPDIIICSNEIGMGVVPLKREDREYREITGRTMCTAASMADEVWRVICGIGDRIK